MNTENKMSLLRPPKSLSSKNKQTSVFLTCFRLIKNKFKDIIDKKKGERKEKESQVLELVNDMEEWLAKKEAEQAEVPKTENPVYLAEDIYKRTKKLEAQYKDALGIKDKSTTKESDEYMSMQTKLGLFVILILGKHSKEIIFTRP
jgi:uncharacterized protein YjaZ